MELRDATACDDEITGARYTLPVLPEAAASLGELDPADPGHFERLIALVSVDPALAVRVIGAANASGSSPAADIDTLPTAIARLGSLHISELVTSIAGTVPFTARTAPQQRLWTHAVETATVSQLVAESFHLGPTFSQHMYLCGLLHDLGRFVMFDEHPDQLGAVEDIGWSTAAQLIATEHRIWGFDHAELGYRACRHWGLPDDIAVLVRSHHLYDGHPLSATDDFDAERLEIVQFADMVSLLRANVATGGTETCIIGPATDGVEERDRLVEAVCEHFARRGLEKLPIRIDAMHHIVSEMLRASTAAEKVLGFSEPL